VLKIAKRISTIIDALNEWVGRGIAWLAAVMVVLTVYDVLMRYIFHAGSVAVYEMEWHLFAINFLIAAGWVLKHDGHVRVDLLYTRFSPRTQAWIDLAGSMLACIPFCILVIWASLPFVHNSWVLGEGSPDPGGLPARYILKAMIPLGFFFIAIQALSQAIKKFFFLMGHENEEVS